MRRASLGTGVARAASVALLLGLALPLYWSVVGSLTPTDRLLGAPPLVPTHVTFEHFRAIFRDRDFLTPIRNSLVVAGATTLLCVTLGSIAAYAVARLRFRGKRVVLVGILAVAMFPQVSIVSPLYLLLRALGLIDTYPGLVLPYLTFAMPLTIWLLVGYFRQLPPDLEDAARVDGASRAQAFREVVVPLAMPGIVTTAILTFLYSWNEFLFALSFTVGPGHQTVPVAIALFSGRYRMPWGQVLAGAVVATVPVVLLVALFQHRIVRGLTAGATKG